MKRKIRVIAIVAALVLVAILCLPFLVDANQFRPRLESELTKALGREVTVGDLKLSIFSGGVTASDLAVADDPSFSRQPFIRAKSLKLGVELWPLVVSRKLNVTGLTIDQPEIVLLQTASGTWNFSSMGGKTGAKTPPQETPAAAAKGGLDRSVKLIKIGGGHISVGEVRGGSKPLVLDQVNAELRDFSASSVFPFSFSTRVAGGGEVRLEGKAGPIDATDVAMTPLDLNLRVTRLDLAASGLTEPSSGVAGLVSLDGACALSGHKLTAKGRVKAERLKLAKNGSPARRPVEFDFAVEHDLVRRSGVLSRGDVHIGSATAALTGTYARQGESSVLHMKLSGPDMSVPELAELLPALGVVLPAGSSLEGGTAHASLTLDGPLDKLVTAGSLGLANTRLAGFDLGTKVLMAAKLAGVKAGRDTDIQTFSAGVHADPDGIQAQDITLIAPSVGELNGTGTVSATKALDFKMRVKLHTSGGLMGALGHQGDTTVPFLVRGTASNPSFEPDVRGLASEEVKSVLKGKTPGQAASGLLDSILGRKKQQQDQKQQ